MNQIQNISRALLCVFNALIILLPLGMITIWLFIDSAFVHGLFNTGFLTESISTPEGYVRLSQVNWSAFTRIIGFGSDVLSFSPFIIGLFLLRVIFRNYERHVIFSGLNVLCYQKLGWLFFFDALLVKPISQMLMVLAITFSNPPGHRYITISFGTPNLKALFFGALLIVVSWVMLEATKLHDEQQYIV